MERRKQKQTNFRLSDGAIDVLEEAARMAKTTKTEVVEGSIAQYALKFPQLEDKARRLMLEVIKRMKIAPFKRAGDQAPGQEESLAEYA